MPIDEGWTHVKRKSRRKAPANRANAAATSHQPAEESFTPRTTGTVRPPEALRADHDRFYTQWLDSPAHEALVALVDSHAKKGLRVTKAVCLGIGTFDPADGAWEAKRAAYVQLCALSTLTSQLEKYNKGSTIECIFQEPILTDSDKTFLTALGHRIVASPAAYALIDDETLLFAVHLYRPIYAAALQSCLPAIFVGTGWDVWDTVTIEDAHDLDNMKKMDESYTRHAFPQDTAGTAFSSTSIYFRPPPPDNTAAAAASRPPSPETHSSSDEDDPSEEESCGKDTASRGDDAAHGCTDEPADKVTDETAGKTPDKCADDKAGDDDAKGPVSERTVKDGSDSEEKTPP